MNKIIKQKPIWLWQCNLMQINGCIIYCNQYVESTSWRNCKHRKVLCKIIEKEIDIYD